MTDDYQYQPASFGLGTYWIISSYLTSAFFTPLAIFVSIMAQGATGTSIAASSVFVSLACLLAGVLLIGSAWGLHSRQIVGVYFTYAYLGLQLSLALALTIYTLITWSSHDIPAFAYLKIGTGGVFTLLSLLWWRYFATRIDLFE